MSLKNNARIASKLHLLIFRRPVRKALYWLKHLVIPGCKGVPIWDVLRFFFAGIANGVLWQRAKGLSYSFLMAIPPLLIFMFTLIAYLPVDGLQDELLQQLQEFVPGNFYDKIADTVNDVMGHKHSNLLSIGFIVSVILAANGMHGLLMSFNYANKSIERRPFLQRYALCLMLVFLLFALIAAILSLLIGYKFIIGWLIKQGMVPHTKLSLFFISFGRWVILTLLTLLVVCVIYYWAPMKKQRVGFFSIGSVLATLLFFGLSWGFQAYITNVNQYSLLYGSIGTLLLIMLWIFLNCLVLLVGYELNISVLNGKISQEEFAKLRATRSAMGMSAQEADNDRIANLEAKRMRDLEEKRKMILSRTQI